MFIFHIVSPEIWESFKGKSLYEAESLQDEGFIHCSYEHQISGVISRYFAFAERLVVLKLNTGKLRSRLVEEPSTNGEIFPHVYGYLNADAIVAAETLILQPPGRSS